MMNNSEMMQQTHEDPIEEEQAYDGPVFRSFNEACHWSRENGGQAFTRCAKGDNFRPVENSEAYQVTQSWHDFEELYIDGPYRNEMS